MNILSFKVTTTICSNIHSVHILYMYICPVRFWVSPWMMTPQQQNYSVKFKWNCISVFALCFFSYHRMSRRVAYLRLFHSLLSYIHKYWYNLQHSRLQNEQFLTVDRASHMLSRLDKLIWIMVAKFCLSGSVQLT